LTKKNNPKSSTLSAGDARLVMGWKIIEYLGLALFLIIIPREMGPERYGEFAVLGSLLGLFMIAGSLCGQAAFGRCIVDFARVGITVDPEVWCRRRIDGGGYRLSGRRRCGLPGFLLGEIFAVARYWSLFSVGILALVLSYSRLLPEIAGGVLALSLLLATVFLLRILRLDEIRWITGGSKRNL